MVLALEMMSWKTISAHAAKNLFAFTCFGSGLLSITVSVLTTRCVMQVAKSSPVALKTIMAIGIPRRQLMMVKPLPSCVLGVILPYPIESNHHSIADYIKFVTQGI